MFQRIAHNYAKNGYFPTDEESMTRLLTVLRPCKTGMMRIIDPCAGEGSALAECKHHLGSDSVEAFAVEYDLLRSKQAKKLADRCIQGDFQDTVITPRSFGLLFLNPPYGDLVTDKAQTSTQFVTKGRKRLEKMFYQHSTRLLQAGGVLVLIVPHYSLDAEFRKWLAAGFEKVQIYLAPEQQFKQAIIFGVKKTRRIKDEQSRQVLAQLETFCASDNKAELPEIWDKEPYVVPAGLQQDIRFNCLTVDERQLMEQISQFPCLWQQYSVHLSACTGAKRRPLMKLSDWHLALALAAGEVSGVVHSNDGTKTYVIKGDTYKDKKNTVMTEESASGEISEIRTSIDVFVPVIKALDFTPDSPTFGQVLTIK